MLLHIETLKKYNTYFKHLNRQRKDYYCVETIRRFIRDTATDSRQFEVLKEEIYNGIIDVHEQDYENGYKRLVAALKQAIEKIIVSGPGKTESIIELSDGLNIIYGPSNTGKTYIVMCIDYMFGSDKEPIDASAGYKNIVIVVKTPYGTITMNRKIGDSKISVVSTDKNIVSGKYSTNTSRKNYDKTINYVWLSLIGIKDMHLINKNEYFKKQILSWRTFCHIFMLTETRIISENSVLLSDRYSNNTAVISSLIFLLTNKDFAEIEVKDSKEIKDAKKDAIKTYINKELFRLSERNQKLITQIKDYSDVDINKEIEEIISFCTELIQNLSLKAPALRKSTKVL